MGVAVMVIAGVVARIVGKSLEQGVLPHAYELSGCDDVYVRVVSGCGQGCKGFA